MRYFLHRTFVACVLLGNLMSTLITGGNGGVGSNLVKFFNASNRPIKILTRDCIDFNYNHWNFNFQFEDISTLVIFHGELFDKINDPTLALENFKNTRLFIKKFIEFGQLKKIVVLLSDCVYLTKYKYEWYSYNKVLLDKYLDFLDADLIVHRYYPGRINTNFHKKFDTTFGKEFISSLEMAEVIFNNLDVDENIKWKGLTCS